MKKLLLLYYVTLMLFPLNAISKTHIIPSVGFGIPEFANAGLKIELRQMKFGISVGTAFSGKPVFSGDVYLHFAGHSELTEVKPWYLRSTITYWTDPVETIIDLGEYYLLSFRIGRELNISKSFGLNIDAGTTPFFLESGIKTPMTFIPSLSISLFSRL